MLAMLAAQAGECETETHVTNANGFPHSHAMMGKLVQDWFAAADIRGSLHARRKGEPPIPTAIGAVSYELDVLFGHKTGSQETQTDGEAAKRPDIAAHTSLKIEGVTW